MNKEASFDTATQLRSSASPTNLAGGLEAMAEFAERVDELDEALADLADVTGESTSRSVERLRRNLAEFEPSVTILGQVKSGKTSLVNAMAGWADLLPSDVNPWTSVVTSLHLTPGPERAEIGARFRFMTEEEWDRLLSKGGRIGELAGRAGAGTAGSRCRRRPLRGPGAPSIRIGARFGSRFKAVLERRTVLPALVRAASILSG